MPCSIYCSELDEDMIYSRKGMMNIQNQGSVLGGRRQKRLFDLVFSLSSYHPWRVVFLSGKLAIFDNVLPWNCSDLLKKGKGKLKHNKSLCQAENLTGVACNITMGCYNLEVDEVVYISKHRVCLK